MRCSSLIAATTLAALTGAASAQGVMIYATNHMGHYPNIGDDTLIVFDSTNPAGFQTIGSLGQPDLSFGGLEFDRDGRLWAYASNFSATGGAASGLYRIDLNTGAATVQGTISPQTLNDLAFNPVNNTMYGVYTQGRTTSRLYSVNLDTGQTTLAGQFNGLPSNHSIVGMAIDSSGNYYLHDLTTDKIFKADSTLNAVELYDIGAVTTGSQGLGIDWSRDDQGYHGAIGQGVFPNYFNQLNAFQTDGSGYTWGPDFGPNYPDGLPLVQPGDLAIMPVPAPASLALALLAAPLATRRRRP